MRVKGIALSRDEYNVLGKCICSETPAIIFHEIPTCGTRLCFQTSAFETELSKQF
jgi:hypothetical protein